MGYSDSAIHKQGFGCAKQPVWVRVRSVPVYGEDGESANRVPVRTDIHAFRRLARIRARIRVKVRVHAGVRLTLALTLTLTLTLTQVHADEVFRDGLFNGDPHPGNILLLDDGRLGLIDYGQIKSLPHATRLSLARLFVALQHDHRYMPRPGQGQGLGLGLGLGCSAPRLTDG